MSADDAKRERFAKAWAGAIERALPPLDVERGATRLVEVMREREDARPRAGFRFALVSAAMAVLLTGLAVAGSRWLFDRGALELTVDGKRATTASSIGGSEPHLIRFSNGSTIALDPKSALDLTEAAPDRVGVTLQHGAASFDVAHGQASRWDIGAGPFQVRVLGTAFRVEWRAESQRFSLRVTRGAVRVRGPLLSGEQVISAGASCAVDLSTQRATFGTDPTGVEEPEAAAVPEGVTPGDASQRDGVAEPSPSPAASQTAPAPTTSVRPAEPAGQAALDWRALERQGQFDKAIQEAVRAGVDDIYARAKAEDLMGLARAARLAGRLDLSKGALLSCRRRFAGTRDAAMAAYLLGRNAAPAEAAHWFSTYLGEQPNGALAREASGRLIEAHFGAGQRDAARAQARAYLLRYPSGPHADFAKMVLAR